MRIAFEWLQSAWRRLRRKEVGSFAVLGERIAQHGWTGMYVGDYATAPTWAYSVGFAETLGQPEVIVFDLPQDAADALLGEVFTQLKDGRLALEDGRVWPEGEAHPCVWRKVDTSQLESDRGWFTFAMVRSLLRTGMPYAFEAFQLVLSDNEGRLPWEEGYDELLRPRQPALYLPLEETPSPLAEDRGV